MKKILTLIIALATFTFAQNGMPIHKTLETRTIAVLWTPKLGSDDDTRSMLQTYVEHLLNNEYGFKLVTREQKDVFALLEESQFNESGLTKNTIDVVGKVNNLDGVIRMQLNKVSGGDSYLSMKLIAYPSGEMISSSEPILVSGELKDVAQKALNTLLRTYTSSWRQNMQGLDTLPKVKMNELLPKSEVKQKMPVWAKVAGYMAIATFGYTMYELNEANKSIELHRGSVLKETADKHWNEYQTHRNNSVFAGIATLGLGLTWTLGF